MTQDAPRHTAVKLVGGTIAMALILVAGYTLAAVRQSSRLTVTMSMPVDTGPSDPSPSVSLSASPSGSPSASAAIEAIDPSGPTQAALATYVSDQGVPLAAGVYDRTTGRQVLVGDGTQFQTASIVKVDILATLLLQLQRAGKTLSSAQKSLATRMITDSDNDAASSLWSQIGSGTGLAAANKTFGLTHTTPGPAGYWGSTKTTVSDQLRLLRVLADPDSVLSAASRSYELSLMSQVESDQRWGVPTAAPSGTTAMYVKNGWLDRPEDGDRWVINTVGRIVMDGHDLLVVVLSSKEKTESTGIAVVQGAAKIAVTGLNQ